MKKDYLLLLAITLLTFSCSDELSNSKAENIIEDCLEKKPYRESILFKTGEIQFNVEDEKEMTKLSQLKDLANEGLITVDSVSHIKKRRSWSKEYYVYNIAFTDKCKDFVIESDYKGAYYSLYGSRKTKTAKVKVFDYELDEVKEVHEIPSLNAAEVRAVYKRVDETPFVIFYDGKDEFKTKKEGFRKTSNGWKFCD